jgi:cytochrome c peroxidase
MKNRALSMLIASRPMRRLAVVAAAPTLCGLASAAGFTAGERVPAAEAADRAWELGVPPAPANNATTPARVSLGRTLFFDPRLSGNGTISCATCHNPALGWSDGLRTGVGINGSVLGRATPTVINTAYNTQFMWDGRKRSLEDQALGPMMTPEEMRTDFPAAVALLSRIPGYRSMFKVAYPGEEISTDTIAKAIAAFERTVVSRDSRFDRWVTGDRRAITMSEWRGYQVFKDPARGNCVVCHKAPNFTDNGYHNIGIAHAPGQEDVGRFKHRPVAVLKGAFKTPTLRDVALTAPYFHNGSAASLADVVEHYARGGDDTSNLSQDIRKLALTPGDKQDLVAFMQSLNGKPRAEPVPALPQ